MHVAATRTLSAGPKVAIVDDDPIDRQRLVLRLRKEGFNSVGLEPQSGRYSSIEQLINDVKDSDFVLCDHKLRQKNYASFEGAEAVSTMFTNGKPAVLLTQYLSPEHSKILKFRQHIPYILERGNLNTVAFTEIFKKCQQEIAGNPPDERKTRRVLIQIDSIRDENPQALEAVVFIPTWRQDKAVYFPISIVPEALQGEVREGNMLFAKVNIGAKDENDLFFCDFEKAPPPIEEKKLEPASRS